MQNVKNMLLMWYVYKQDGKVVWRGRYSAWGKLLYEEGALKQNLRMQGQYHDRETDLCYNTFRYYDSDIGRFITEDPIGLGGGHNLYQYAPNPIAWIDPWGWFCGPRQKHHPIPQFLGGDKKQDLITLDKDPHVEFHGSLNDKLKNLFGMRGGGPGGGKVDWINLFQNNPGSQTKALDAVLDVAIQVDSKHGTNIVGAFLENITKGKFTSYP